MGVGAAGTESSGATAKGRKLQMQCGISTKTTTRSENEHKGGFLSQWVRATKAHLESDKRFLKAVHRIVDVLRGHNDVDSRALRRWWHTWEEDK